MNHGQRVAVVRGAGRVGGLCLDLADEVVGGDHDEDEDDVDVVDDAVGAMIFQPLR